MRGRTAAVVSKCFECYPRLTSSSPLATPLIQWEAPDDRIVTFSMAFMWAARGFCDSDTLSVVFLDYFFIFYLFFYNCI